MRKKGKKYTWIIVNGHCYCDPDPGGGQTVGKLWEVQQLTAFHDRELAAATKEINRILDGVRRRNKDSSRVPSFIEHDNRLLLVWARYDIIGQHDDPDDITKTLGLRRRS